MTPERWQRVKEILDRAAACSDAGKRTLVEEACGDDAELRREVESFLELDGEVEDFIEEPWWTLHDQRSATAVDSSRGRRIGPYRIERLIGRGGMGSVYLAVREDDYRQRVALKLVLDSGAARALRRGRTAPPAGPGDPSQDPRRREPEACDHAL